jgi:hypothetical protein
MRAPSLNPHPPTPTPRRGVGDNSAEDADLVEQKRSLQDGVFQAMMSLGRDPPVVSRPGGAGQGRGLEGGGRGGGGGGTPSRARPPYAHRMPARCPSQVMQGLRYSAFKARQGPEGFHGFFRVLAEVQAGGRGGQEGSYAELVLQGAPGP